jgi:hypothetical protein
MENYIVRIYRRDKYRPDLLVGLVQAVETGKIRSFRTLSELTAILSKTPMMMGELEKEKSCFELG